MQLFAKEKNAFITAFNREGVIKSLMKKSYPRTIVLLSQIVSQDSFISPSCGTSFKVEKTRFISRVKRILAKKEKPILKMISDIFAIEKAKETMEAGTNWALQYIREITTKERIEHLESWGSAELLNARLVLSPGILIKKCSCDIFEINKSNLESIKSEPVSVLLKPTWFGVEEHRLSAFPSELLIFFKSVKRVQFVLNQIAQTLNCSTHEESEKVWKLPLDQIRQAIAVGYLVEGHD